MKKRITVFFLIFLLSILSACGKKNPDTETGKPITVYVPKEIVSVTTDAVNAWNKENGNKVSAQVVGVSPSELLKQIKADTELPNLYVFSLSDFDSLLTIPNALAPLSEEETEYIRENMLEGPVSLSYQNDHYFAYPFSITETTVLYYDSSVIPRENLAFLEDALLTCEDAERTFYMDLSSSPYGAASFFYATGCISRWTQNENGIYTKVQDTFYSDSGVHGAEGLHKLLQSPAFEKESDLSKTEQRPAVVIASSDKREEMGIYFGSNLEITSLPSFVGGDTLYPMFSSMDGLFLGRAVTEDADLENALRSLSQYLTGEEASNARFLKAFMNPARKSATEITKDSSDPIYYAMALQSVHTKNSEKGPKAWAKMVYSLRDALSKGTNADDFSEALKEYNLSLHNYLTDYGAPD